MKPLLIAACIASFSVLPQVSPAEAACHASVDARVEVAPGKFSLADILATDTCPALLRKAAGVPLGSAPLAGSVRVLPGDEVRSLLERLVGNAENGPSGSATMRIPERITVRRAGARASCADIGERILASLAGRPFLDKSLAESGRPPKPLGGTVLPRDMDCGATDRILQETSLQLTKAVWDPALGSWKVSTRCVHPGDCVPFLVRVPGPDSKGEMGNSARQNGSTTAQLALASSSSDQAAPSSAGGKPLVRSGETVTLLWDQDGIRLVIPAVCLDAGGEGQRVRARIATSGRTLPAIVVRAGMLRAAS